ncbi:endolytic transglycosylase MltG [Patescibacteria group bacterium]|jgi:UPF0755 protein|nr:endolytic transglycosylase MltG [Patescibacteria group bacterium]
MKRFITPVLVVVALLSSWFAWVFVSESWFGQTPAPVPTAFVVPENATVAEVASRLEAEKLIPSAWRYRLYARIDRAASRPKSGEYQLRVGSSYREIARSLALGPERDEVQIRVIEGWTVEDITAQLEEAHQIPPDVTHALVGKGVNRAPFDSSLRAEYPFLKNLPGNRSLEGYLYPDTYRVWGDQLPDSLIRKQLDEFGGLFATTTVGPQSAPLKTLDDVIILASIVEAEVRDVSDKRTVAGIFLNRLAAGMALQTDASIGYITGSGRSRSTAKDLSIDSPFNTYKYPGLPPAPINNPGAESIRAVLDPSPNDYLYFLTDTAGNVYYGRTLEEHAANRRKAGF